MKYILVGLGNPGKKYIGTRHNIGRDFLLQLVKNSPNGFSFDDWQENKKADALVCAGVFEGAELLLVLPNTFMNNSGLSVKNILKYENEAELIVLHDDIDMSLGAFKIVFGRGTGGNRGVESLVENLGGAEFVRFKLGVSPKHGDQTKKPPREMVNKFVLSRFSIFDKLTVKKTYKKTQQALETYLKEGRVKAMNLFNG